MLKIVFGQKYKNISLCVLTGAALALSFPKTNLVFLAWAAFIPLFYVICGTEKPAHSFFYAFSAGSVFNLQANFWLINTVELFTGNYFAAVIFYIFFCSYFALYWGLWGLLLSLIKKHCAKPWLFIILSACLWISFEYIRANILTGWPWLIAGYSQYSFTYIIQIAEFTGVYGISFALISVNGFLYFAAAEGRKFYALAAASVFAVLLAFGVFRYNAFKDFGEKEYTAAAVQSNIEQYKKLDYAYWNEIAAVLELEAGELSETGADINVWSESEIINLITDQAQSYDFAAKLAKTAGGFNIIGAPYLDGSQNLFNAVFYFDAGGAYKAVHFKNHLVPFGEYLPVPEPLAELLGIYEKNDDSVRGTDSEVFTDGKLFVGPLICSENFFPSIMRRFVLSGARVLTNHTNDAWYLDSSALHKHFCANVMRCVESRKAMIAASNTGVSAIIDACGKISVSAKVCERAVISGTFRQNGYLTFYVLYGDVFARLCILFFFFYCVFIFFKRHKLNHGNKENLRIF